jgi:branched-chain amino acid aminotransferase
VTDAPFPRPSSALPPERFAADGPRDDGSVVFLDGELVPTAQARVTAFDHGLLYGDGVFETVRVVDGLAFRLEDHLDRLERSAGAIALDLPWTRAELRDALLETAAANGRPMCFCKLILTRGAGSEPLLKHEGLRPRLLITARASMPFVEGDGPATLSAAIVGTRKTPAAALDPRIKSLNYLNIIQSRIQARALAAEESIMLDDRGRVAEGSIYNVIAVRGDELVSPAEGCLEGITLDTLFGLAAERGLQPRRGDVWPYDLHTAQEVLFASTAVGVVAVTTIDGRPVGGGAPGPVFEALERAYAGALGDPARGTTVPGLREAAREEVGV